MRAAAAVLLMTPRRGPEKLSSLDEETRTTSSGVCCRCCHFHCFGVALGGYPAVRSAFVGGNAAGVAYKLSRDWLRRPPLRITVEVAGLGKHNREFFS